MTTSTNIRFEAWEAEQMKDPEFRDAVEELEPEYRAAREEMMDDQDVTTMGMPKDPIKACPARLCAGGLLWNEAVGDFTHKCPTCGGWGFVHDDNSKTLYQCGREFSEAWHEFTLAFAYSLKIDRLCEFLAKLLRRLSASDC